MPPKSSSKLAISSSSFLDLKATISAHESDFKKSRTPVVQGGNSATSSASSSKKLGQWAKQNKGLNARAKKDQVLYEDDVGTGDDNRNPERIRERLEKKAKIYDKIRRGKSGGLNEAQIDSLLVDFDKTAESGSESDSEADDSGADESLTVPKRPRRSRPSSGSESDEPGPPLPSTSDPLVEYTDEFGRTRMIPRSEVPRGAPFNQPASSTVASEGGEEGEQPYESNDTGVFQPGEGPQQHNVLYGDQTSFPVYEPDPAILAQRAATLAAAQNAPLVDHYDSTRETTRQRGAGFYQFSGTEEERKQQMEDLERERKETERKRKEREELGDKVRAERKKEVEERKKMIEDKRRELEEKRLAKKRKL
ncbi:CCDC174 family protein [Sporobolomyces salmoneus]|uniref:CCDC174 family protein n=1 Tax=Sporobolomyces salmoneus TaxID=183962 RepID=UPI00317A6621